MSTPTRCKCCGSLLKSDGKTAAERLFAAFGSPSKVIELTGIDRTSVYRWNYPKTKGGTGGSIPSLNFDRILSAAKKHNIQLTRSDLV